MESGFHRTARGVLAYRNEQLEGVGHTRDSVVFWPNQLWAVLVSPAGFPCLRSARGTLRVAIPCELEQLGKPLVAICDCRVGSHWHFLFIAAVF